jgi:hypothetical protein
MLFSVTLRSRIIAVAPVGEPQFVEIQYSAAVLNIALTRVRSGTTSALSARNSNRIHSAAVRASALGSDIAIRSSTSRARPVGRMAETMAPTIAAVRYNQG